MNAHLSMFNYSYTENNVNSNLTFVMLKIKIWELLYNYN